MTDLQKYQRVCRVFLARLLMVHGEDAPQVLRRMADELEWLEAERVAESNRGRSESIELKMIARAPVGAPAAGVRL